MKSILSSLALFGLFVVTSSAHANGLVPTIPYPYPYNLRCHVPQAPDARGPGYYVVNPCGAVYGPNYWVTPPHPPWQGALPIPQNRGYGCGPGAGGAGGLPLQFHPFARSPRDFFMVYD